MAARVLVTVPLPEPFASRLGQVTAEVQTLGFSPSPDQLCQVIKADPPDVICAQLEDQIREDVFAAAGTRLRAVCDYAVGYNNIDVAVASEHGVAVTNTPGVLTDATADCAMGLMLAVARRLCEGDKLVRAGGFSGWKPDFMLGLDLTGAQLGIVGFGRIGQAVARRALAFGMRVTYAARPSAEVAEDLRGRVTALAFDELIASSDFVSVHCPLTEQTKHLISASVLESMKSTAVLINTARGAVVDEAALVRALQAKQIGGAGLDVYEYEPALAPGLASCENAVLAPHVGSATVNTRSAMAAMVAENAIAALRGLLPPQSVNGDIFAWLGNSLLGD